MYTYFSKKIIKNKKKNENNQIKKKFFKLSSMYFLNNTKRWSK